MNAFAGSLANSIFFYVYSDGKKRYNYNPEKPFGITTMLISYRAGLASMFITTPLWTVKTRIILFQEYNATNSTNQLKSSTQILKHVVKDMYFNEGVKSFYRGFVPSLFMSIYGVIQMYSYETITYLMGYKSGNAKKMTWDNIAVPFFVGGCSRSLASITLMPINVIRMRLQMKNYSVEEVKIKNLA